MLDLSGACAIVRSFDDARTYRLGPALLFPLRLPIDLWPPPPSPQANVTGRFPHRASLFVSRWAESSSPAEIAPPSAGLESDWRVQTAERMELHAARSVRMSRLSSQFKKLELKHSTHAFDLDDDEFLGPLLSHLPNLSDVGINFDTSTLHTVSHRSHPPSPSLDGSLDTSLDYTLEDGIHTPSFDTLPRDPLDALEALAQLQPFRPDTSNKEHLDPIEALLWSQPSYDVHPFRTIPQRSQLYATSEWCEVPPPLPPKDTRVLHFSTSQRRSLDMVKNAGVAATHRRTESTPTWTQATQSKSKRQQRIAQVEHSDSATNVWQESNQVQVKHFHHHHYHHHHVHYQGGSK
ncbi:hypothetical protein CcaverHIS002_0408120 [Cutaneotrichosporon cavernicola]|uniref:Uncharacterized protein n=1 Tax=Cutaneotrichosporon cavernicola TaxID=279322 RepID=A0AA48L4W8_9TREE|nr:uncharacterized protein CcaverHIS019_0408100 [Cutaneotrichosporon cavernicola]BEI84208.1 hypothetical protein CcaverHIS002_0408120 [Cutaneotrichosporon cavernicola]BEI91990.1 hypothetical protein CcaverHIS019_0408100 [Cutaneotrichosporon cavernicola]BEI99761.1 hypothetical protein CcaverHIS631_0408040 [Cutaneotrichosporon cavernicola]BEJ07537.1 hypothetical protein CcaverHIS641_0408060 [Cutaneotrichosporon cavernicola]